MALGKTVEHETGIDIYYWNINRIDIRRNNDYVSIQVFGYINENIYRAGKSNLIERVFIVNNDNGLLDEYFNSSNMVNNIYDIGYKYLKENESFFDGAVDILEEGGTN
ncbi:hypothetical protein [Senegalia massiliensis]|uniref:Uncharacterized protein n=1 Tax=Senegalia massiliensis TaxID=1720316 RepID=A0A845R4B0_9CLOT|nr:hypothetical protein [Senegalia massiliensis]NBI08252.1 hypothetical protein [Senegalia massiliensis]